MSGGGGSKDDDWRPKATPATKPKSKGKGGGDGEPPSGPCNINETTTLNSPNRTVIASLRVGDLLDVVFQAGPPQILAAKTQGNMVAGSITSPSMAQIIHCIHNGYTYVAEVLSIQGALCQVRIQPQ